MVVCPVKLQGIVSTEILQMKQNVSIDKPLNNSTLVYSTQGVIVHFDDEYVLCLHNLCMLRLYAIGNLFKG